MKKLLLSLPLIIVFAIYTIVHRLNGSASANVISPLPTANTNTQASNIPSTPVPTPTPTPQSTPTPTGQYRDGTYTGPIADAYYGNVQVRATISGGKLTNVVFLDYPHDRDTSRYINSQAIPLLKTEAIQAQSGQVNGVSGATDTSIAFRQSLTSALAQAKV